MLQVAAPCVLRFIQDCMKEVSHVTFNQMLLHTYTRVPTSEEPHEDPYQQEAARGTRRPIFLLERGRNVRQESRPNMAALPSVAGLLLKTPFTLVHTRRLTCIRVPAGQPHSPMTCSSPAFHKFVNSSFG
ncbi:uncharacterized protein LOC106997981 [Macaca mulatta]